MIYFPAFRKSFDVNTIPQEGIVALHELGQLVFGGAIEQAVIPLIHGQRSADEIADALADRFPRENVYHALQSMQQQGLVYDRSALDGPALPAAWHYLAWDLDRAQKAVTQTQISVLGTAGLGVTPDIQTFAAYDLKVGIDGSFLVVIAGDYLEPELAAINREALERDRPWMLVKPVGTLALIGPIFRPGVSACWECLAQRLYGRREIERYGENHGAAQIASAAPFNAAASAVQSIAALQIAKWVATGASPLLEGKIVSFDLTSLVTCTHIVNKRPCCAACGTPTPNVRRWPLLDNQARRSSIDSGHRSLSAEETYIRHQHHISPITGIVSELVPIRAPSEEIVKLYIANHNFALSSESLYFLTNSMQTKSCGKGMTEAQARTSALCEALERYCGVYKGDEVAIHKSFRELGDQAIHPNACMLFSERQYQERKTDQWCGSVFNVVPAPFPPDEKIDWTPVWSFASRALRYLPTAYLYYGYPTKGKQPSCWADSNGNAAGNTLEEAIIQGFLELVERDAVAIWWYNRLPRPGVDLASFDIPYISQCIDFYARHGRQLWALDLTTDFGIPAFVAVSRRVDQPSEEIIFGFGAHLDATVALTRAIVEMNQFLPVVNGPIGPGGERVFASHDVTAVEWWRNATIVTQPYLAPHPAFLPRRSADYPGGASDDQLVDLMTCVNRARALGMDTLLLDQTRGDVDMHVVKVIVPGARHFWARFAPGRLYDVPVRLDWLPRALSESELNPVAMFV
jgi:oxazoline/thiazoline synthase